MGLSIAIMLDYQRSEGVQNVGFHMFHRWDLPGNDITNTSLTFVRSKAPWVCKVFHKAEGLSMKYPPDKTFHNKLSGITTWMYETL